MEYTIIQKLTSKSLEKPSKKIRDMMSFISIRFNEIGENISIVKLHKEFATWSEKEKTVVASSLDIHKNFFTACFLWSRSQVNLMERCGRDLKTVAIPSFRVDGHGCVILSVVSADKFEDVYYTTLDALKAEEEKKATATATAEKSASEEVATAESEESEETTATTATAEILSLIDKFGSELDLNAIQKAIDNLTTATAKKSKKSA